MTQIQGKFVVLPPVYEAIQWDGTLDGSLEICEFVDARTEQTNSFRVEYQARLTADENPPTRAIIKLDPYIIHKEHPEEREMWPEMWLLYCPNPRGWQLLSDESLKRDYGMVNEEVA